MKEYSQSRWRTGCYTIHHQRKLAREQLHKAADGTDKQAAQEKFDVFDSSLPRELQVCRMFCIMWWWSSGIVIHSCWLQAASKKHATLSKEFLTSMPALRKEAILAELAKWDQVQEALSFKI